MLTLQSHLLISLRTVSANQVLLINSCLWRITYNLPSLAFKFPEDEIAKALKKHNTLSSEMIPLQEQPATVSLFASFKLPSTR